MTIRERYYEKAKELKLKNPNLNATQLIQMLGYVGSIDSFRNYISKPLNAELKHIDICRPKKFAPSADAILQSMDQFNKYDQNGDPFEPFTDGFYIDPTPIQLATGKRYLVMNDHHIGIHSTSLCVKPLVYAKDRGNIDSIIINGDLLDFGSVSSHAASPYEKMNLKDEIAQAKTYLRLVRGMFPNAEIIYAEGNHEYRLSRFIACNAKQFDGIIFLERLLQLEHFGIQFVPYHKHVQIGHLHVMHGHHIKGSGTNVASTILAKAGVNIMFGDRHRSQEATRKRFDGSIIGAWAVGCLCPLSVSYSLYNPDWINGFAIVESNADGTFQVENKQIIGDKIY
jgi:predicted phosphodiesterase